MAFRTSIFTPARTLRAVCVLHMLAMLSISAHGMGAHVPPPAPTVTPAQTANTTANAINITNKQDPHSFWNELTPAQQQILAPLAPEWNKLDSNHKSKWLAVSKKYAAMSPQQQKRLQENMRDWAKMTPEQHRLARESYAKAKKLNAEQKSAQWQQYQQLPEEQKQKLAADAKAKKRVANVPSLQTKAKPVEPLKPIQKPLLAQTPTQQTLPSTSAPLTSQPIAAQPGGSTVPPVVAPTPASTPPTVDDHPNKQ